ncbi:pre-mRNA-splicing factor prp46 [Entomortierella lignicola]|nr:pre-mRNA-splicing factor prp46 [Entomortierella lignicola]
MGSTRSPSTSTLDPQRSPYSYTQQKRKSSKNSPEDLHDLDNFARKKKKKSKKERHDYLEDEDERPRHHNGHSSTTAATTSQQQQQEQKLPTIKISLRLPSNPSIISPTTKSSTSHKTSSATKKKRRLSEQINVDSDDGDEEDQHSQHHRRSYQLSEREYSEDDQESRLSSSHKKKKKHKHKHKHRHPKHDEQEVEEQKGWDQDVINDEEHYHENTGSNETGAAKITLRLGKESTKGQKNSASQRTHPNHPLNDVEKSESVKQRKPSIRSKARSRSRSKSQSVVYTPVDIKQEELPYQNLENAHNQVGQKRPFSSLVSQRSESQRSESQDTDMVDQTPERVDEDDLDDPLLGELDDPEDEEDEDEDDEDEDDDQQNDRSDDEGMMSPTTDLRMQHHFGSKSVKGGQMGSKTVPQSATASKSTKPKKPKVSKGETAPEGSVASVNRSGRKGKAAKRQSTPRISTPAVPKKKELSVICHKLLDNFIRKDMYVLFTEPVDPTLVPDYATVIKNPMDFSTMRAKVERNFYPDIDEFLKDFQLVCDNARLYNSKETLYWKQADKLWEWGSKAIERERKSVLDKDEELLKTVKDEETLDVGGMGDYSNNVTSNHSRAPLLSADSAIDSPISFPDTGRSHTPQQYRKTKKIKHRRDGTIAFTYSTDGSIDPASHPDPWSLVPVVQDFGSAPLVCPLVETNLMYNGQYLDDYPYWREPKSGFRPAAYLDYGPYAILGKPPTDTGNSTGVQNIPAYTGMVFGDEKGEAYVRSIAMFLDGIVDETELATMDKADTAGLLEVKEYIRKKVETLTRGASTIVDKVAAVIREEKTGRPSEVDTRVPLSLWQQNFDVKEEVKAEEAKQADTTNGNVGDADVSNDAQSIPPEQTNDVEMETTKEVANEATDEADSKASEAEGRTNNEVKDEPTDVVKDETLENVKHEAKAESSDEIMKEPEVEKQEVKDEGSMQDSPPITEWIDIRQVIRDIQAWPKVLREKTDYETWKQLKIELDSLLPASQRSAPTAPSTTPEDVVNVKWGQTWIGGNSEESKRWVREYLEQNSSDMRQIVQLLAAKNTSQMTSTAVATPSGDTSNSVTAATLSGEQEKALVAQLIKSIRSRLCEMVQYVPLAEINPQRLPPPIPPASTTNSVSTSGAVSPAAASSNAQTPQATVSLTRSNALTPTTDHLTTSAFTAASVRNNDSSPAITATTTTSSEIIEPTPSTPDTPGEGSTSSLSSPGSSP